MRIGGGAYIFPISQFYLVISHCFAAFPYGDGQEQGRQVLRLLHLVPS